VEFRFESHGKPFARLERGDPDAPVALGDVLAWRGHLYVANRYYEDLRTPGEYIGEWDGHADDDADHAKVTLVK
jgi:hypothetical protein